jgi:hypothetical protein
MAERLRKRHQDDVRVKIQASQLINVLQNHALGDGSDLSPTRMKAIELLLKKSLPDLSSTEITGDADQPVSIKVITGIDV